MTTIQVALVEDQTHTRQGLAAMIDGTPDFHVEAATSILQNRDRLTFSFKGSIPRPGSCGFITGSEVAVNRR